MKTKALAIFFWMLTTYLVQAQSPSANCILNTADLHPVIDRYNPFFTDKTWENDSKTETARLDAHRLLVIKQKACTRHHVLLVLHVDPAAIVQEDRFWITEMLVLMKRVYFSDPEYAEYKAKFEKEFVRQFLAVGLNSSFNFPIDDRTFICKIESGDWGAKIRLESVKFLVKERINQPGIAREKDDGWLQGKN
jgi:hypothetical protein